MRAPIKPIEDLINICKESETNVVIWEPALDGARYFGLFTSKEIKAQIGNGFFEEYEYANTKPLQKWKQNLGSAPKVEAYNFHAGNLYGYIAYFYSGTTGNGL